MTRFVGNLTLFTYGKDLITIHGIGGIVAIHKDYVKIGLRRVNH